MQSGTQVMRDIQAAAQQARSRVDALTSELRDGEMAVQRLAAQRGEAVTALAKHYLPRLDDPSIERTFAEVEGQLRLIQARRTRRLDELSAEIAGLEQQRAEREEALDAITAQLDEQVRRRTELEAQAAALLEADHEFATLSTRAAEAERQLHQDEARAEELEREAAEKLPAYDNSRLFTYLRDREFGTQGYRSRGLIRRLDRWVAELIGYANSKRGYDFLQVTPRLVAQEVERRRGEFEDLMDQVEAREDTAAAEVGLPPVLAAGEQLGEQRDNLVDAVSQLQEVAARRGEELAVIERSEGEFYEEALARLRQHLEQTEAAVLARRAAGTPEAVDDQLAAEIGDLAADLRELTPRLADRSRERAQLDQRALHLEDTVRRFRSSNFDATRSRFVGLDLRNALRRVLDGEADAASLWRTLEDHQRFEPAPRLDHMRGWHDSSASVLVEAMGNAVGAALRSAARRSVVRRSGISLGRSRRGGGSGGSRRRRRGGFTSGQGF
ncbi:MAG: hypothetical protein AAF628_16875 [Planctomycetota bacterium]